MGLERGKIEEMQKIPHSMISEVGKSH